MKFGVDESAISTNAMHDVDAKPASRNVQRTLVVILVAANDCTRPAQNGHAVPSASDVKSAHARGAAAIQRNLRQCCWNDDAFIARAPRLQVYRRGSPLLPLPESWRPHRNRPLFGPARRTPPAIPVETTLTPVLFIEVLLFVVSIRELQKAANRDPLSNGPRAVLSKVLADAGRYDEALDICEKTLRLRPHNWVIYQNLGIPYWEKGDYTNCSRARASVTFRRALSLWSMWD